RCWRTWSARRGMATWPGRVTNLSTYAARRRPRSTIFVRQRKAGRMPNAIPVLVVDDDPVASAQLGALAKAAGYEVRSAPNGREAWELLQLARVPIIISDWYMPEMDGPELCRRIRARTREPYIYFILVTVRGGKQQYLSGMEAGADDFITKPVTRTSCAPASMSRSASSGCARRSSSSRYCSPSARIASESATTRRSGSRWSNTSRSISSSCSAMASALTATPNTCNRSSIAASLRDGTRHSVTAGAAIGRRILGHGAGSAAWLAPRLHLRPPGPGDRAARDSHGRGDDHGVGVRRVGRVLGRPHRAGCRGHGRTHGIAPDADLHGRDGAVDRRHGSGGSAHRRKERRGSRGGGGAGNRARPDRGRRDRRGGRGARAPSAGRDGREPRGADHGGHVRAGDARRQRRDRHALP